MRGGGRETVDVSPDIWGFGAATAAPGGCDGEQSFGRAGRRLEPSVNKWLPLVFQMDHGSLSSLPFQAELEMGFYFLHFQ